jgi:hypothetical protein
MTTPSWNNLVNERTTDLAVVRVQPLRFTWGTVIAIYTVGPYDIVEYHPWKRNERSRNVLTGDPDLGKTEFHVYVEGKSTSHGFASLDGALAGAIAYRVEGPNHAADRYFIRALHSIEEEG